MSIEDFFPGLKNTGYVVTSAPSEEYNCVAWAASEDDRWWWPDPLGLGYWPADVNGEETLQAVLEPPSYLLSVWYWEMKWRRSG